jgi:hypothetical protein
MLDKKFRLDEAPIEVLECGNLLFDTLLEISSMKDFDENFNSQVITNILASIVMAMTHKELENITDEMHESLVDLRIQFMKEQEDLQNKYSELHEELKERHGYDAKD